jgi:choline dehydrogenase-like flavoprotein
MVIYGSLKIDDLALLWVFRRTKPLKTSRTHAELRVYGVKNLRIADGSIMPSITTGNTQAPCVIIGERMADILKA